jgi:hypothetical protein
MFISDNKVMGKHNSTHSSKRKQPTRENSDEWFTDLDILGIKDMSAYSRYKALS